MRPVYLTRDTDIRPLVRRLSILTVMVVCLLDIPAPSFAMIACEACWSLKAVLAG